MKKSNKLLALFLAASMLVTSIVPTTAVKAEESVEAGAASEAAVITLGEITPGEFTITKVKQQRIQQL